MKNDEGEIGNWKSPLKPDGNVLIVRETKKSESIIKGKNFRGLDTVFMDGNWWWEVIGNHSGPGVLYPGDPVIFRSEIDGDDQFTIVDGLGFDYDLFLHSRIIVGMCSSDGFVSTPKIRCWGIGTAPSVLYYRLASEEETETWIREFCYLRHLHPEWGEGFEFSIWFNRLVDRYPHYKEIFDEQTRKWQRRQWNR